MKIKDHLLNNKIKYVDRAGNITYSLLTGTILDIASGLDFAGVLASRGYATLVNYLTGPPYMGHRERMFRKTKTTKDSGKLRKRLVDLLSFNTFQTPIYMGAVTCGELVQKGADYLFSDGDFNIDLTKAIKGGLFLLSISPIIEPTMNLWCDGTRKVFGIKPAVERAYEKGNKQL